MDTEGETSPDRSGPAGGGRFTWLRFAFWLVACLVLAVPVAWAADVVQSDFKFAPLVIFPLLVGVGLGAIAVGLMRLGQVGNRPTILLGVVLAGALTVVGQHYLRYWDECERVQRQVDAFREVQLKYPKLVEGYQPKPPAHFAAYMQAQAKKGRDLEIGGYVARGGVAWLTWVIDGLLLLAAALAMVIPAMRLPFCNRCRSWYRVTQSGRADGQTARRLAGLAEVPPEDRPDSARYRLLSCNGGCGPTSFELSWQKPRGPSFSAQAWLDAARRDRITRVLDEARQKTEEGGQ